MDKDLVRREARITANAAALGASGAVEDFLGSPGSARDAARLRDRLASALDRARRAALDLEILEDAEHPIRAVALEYHRSRVETMPDGRRPRNARSGAGDPWLESHPRRIVRTA